MQMSEEKIGRETILAVCGERKTLQENWHRERILNLCEFMLSHKLNNLCNGEGIEISPEESATLFHRLAMIYRKRSPDKIALIKSAILLNAALSRNCECEDVRKDLEELCQHVLDTSCARFRKTDLLQSGISFKESIDDFRKSIKNQVKDENVCTDKAIKKNQVEPNHTTAIENLQKEIYEWYCNLMKRVMDHCASLVGPAPCSYALVGMGSLARKEITPYSDFEHIILLEEGVQKRKDYNSILEYFRWVSTIFNIVLVNLGETIVPCAALPYLNKSGNKNYNWFYDVFTKRGITIDGMFAHASKFPLGRSGASAKPWKTELIKPVSKMLKYLSGNESLKNGYHLSDILTCTCFISGDLSIHESFETGVKSNLDKLLSKHLLQQQLKDDMMKFSAINNLDIIGKKEKWNMKQVVYRTLTLFVAALGKFHGLCEGSSFNVIRKLTDKGVLEASLASDFLESVAIACYIRLSTYIKSDRQEDWIENSQSNQTLFQFEDLPSGTALRYYQTVMKLQRKTCEIIGLHNCSFVQWSPQLDKLLLFFWFHEYEEVLWEVDRMLEDGNLTDQNLRALSELLIETGLIYNRKKNFHRAVLFFHRAHICNNLDSTATEDDKTYCLDYLRPCCLASERFQESEIYYRGLLNHCLQSGVCEIRDGMKKDIRRLSIALAERNKHEEAANLLKLSFAVESRNSEDNDLQNKIISDALPEYYLGDALLDKEKYAQATWHFRKAVDAFEQFISGKQENNRSKQNEYDTNNSGLEDYKVVSEYLVKCYCKLGTSLLNVKNFENAITCLEYSEGLFKICGTAAFAKKRLRLVKNLGECLYQQERYAEALQRFERAMHMANSGVMSIPKVCEECLYNVKKCTVRIQSKSEADISSKRELEASAKDVGDYLFEKGDYAEALEFYNIATNLEILVDETKENPQALAQYFKAVGICFFKTNSFPEALKYFFQVQNIQKKFRLFTSGKEMADQFHLIAKCLFAQGKHQEAFKHYEEAITWQRKVTQGVKADKTMAVLYKDLGSCCYQLKKYNETIVHCLESIKAPDRTDDNESNEIFINATELIGDYHYQQMNTNQALKYYKEALSFAEEHNMPCETQKILHQLCRKIGFCHFKMQVFDRAKCWFNLSMEMKQ